MVEQKIVKRTVKVEQKPDQKNEQKKEEMHDDEENSEIEDESSSSQLVALNEKDQPKEASDDKPAWYFSDKKFT